MKRIKRFFNRKKKLKYIVDFDEEAFLDANPDIRDAIKGGQFRDVKHHLMLFGLNEIKKGLRPFHRAHEVFNEEKYLKQFPDVKNAIEKGEFQTAFEHFCDIGYKKILQEKENTFQILSDQKEQEKSQRFIYMIDTLDRYRVAGWVFDVQKNKGALSLHLYINGKFFKSLTANQVRSDVLKEHGVKNCGFSSDLGDQVKEEKAFYLELKIVTEEEEISLVPQPLFVTDSSAILETFFTIQNFLKKEANSSVEYEIMRRAFLNFISDGRKHYIQDLFTASMSTPSVTQMSMKSFYEEKDPKVNVIIPVYRDISITKGCIESVLNAKSNISFHIVIINDKSPDIEMQNMLNSYKDNPIISILENEQNLGFVKTVNKGMKYSLNDVILLNSDTIVTDHWIDKLYDVASSDKTIATVTPMSNSATILSYPKTLRDNELPLGFSPQKLNLLFEKLHSAKVVDLPTAHGFCMYIKRVVLEEIGYFDEEKYGKGYGEENDFSMRALSMGWRNVATCDTFIAHIGSVSFSSDKEALAKHNLEILTKDYPEYSAMVRRFIAKDPLREIRRAVSKEILKSLSTKYMLFISHALGGGTQKAMKDLASLLKKESISVLTLKKEEGLYTVSMYENDFLLEYKKEEWTTLLEDLKTLNIFHIHFHHLLGMDWEVTKIPEFLNVPYDFTIHDYLSICPRINLVDENKVYCGEPEISICEECIQKNGVHPGVEELFVQSGKTISEWRNEFNMFLSGARSIFVPNEDVAMRMQSYFKALHFTIKPHPEKRIRIKMLHRQREEQTVLNVAIIGAISDIKGYSKLKELVKDAQKRSLPIRYVVIGYTQNDAYFDAYSNIVITGKYVENELSQYVEKYKCTLALFLSVCPETYSYTLSESLSLGLFPVSFDIGAIASRLRAYQIGKILPLGATIEDINNALVQINYKNADSQLYIGLQYVTILKDYYKFPNKKMED